MRSVNTSGIHASHPGIAIIALSFACALVLRWGAIEILPLCAVPAVALVISIIRRSDYGFAALPPLLLATSFPPAFSDPGTILFIMVASVWIVAELCRVRRATVPPYPSWLGKIMLLAAIIIIINLATAMHNGIAFSAWLRGLFPFLLFGLTIPLLLHKRSLSHWSCFVLALGLACLVLSAEILWIYCINQLWAPIASSSDLAQQFFSSAVGKHFAELNGTYEAPTIFFRITYILPEAAGLLPALGTVGWALAAHNHYKYARAFAVTAAAVCFCAAIATATRSMIFCCGLSIAIALMIYYWNSRERLLLSLRVGITVLLLSTPFLLGTPALQNLMIRTQTILHHTGKAIHASQDVGYRLQEYSQAWSAFVDAPLTGHGFGYIIKLAFVAPATGEQVVIKAPYTHNWIIYWLMVAGIPGLVLYGLITLVPLVKLHRFRSGSNQPITLVLAGSGILIASYGLFFAIYRTLPNVLGLTMLLAWAISNWSTPASARHNGGMGK